MTDAPTSRDDPRSSAPAAPGGSEVVAKEAQGWRIAVWLSLAVAALIPVVLLPLAWQYVSPLPAWDQWSFVEVWDAHGAGRPVLPLLLQPYNGHYNVVTKMFLFGLGLITHWSMRAECVASGLTALLTLVVILRMLAETERRLLVLAAPVSAWVFSLSQFENFVTGYCLGQMLAQLLATLSLYLVTRARSSWWSWCGAVASAAVGACCQDVALAVWPAGLLALLLAPRGKGRLTRVAGWMVGTLGAVLMLRALAGSVGVRPDLMRALPFLVSVVGSPLAVKVWDSTAVTVRLGWAVLAALAVTAVVTLTRVRQWWSARWIAFGTMGVVSAGLIALGRSGGSLRQSLASHYITSAYPVELATLVLATAVWLLPLATRPGPRRRATAVALIAGLSLLVLVRTEKVSADALRYMRHFWPLGEAHNAALLAGTATDAEIMQTHHERPQLVRWGVGVLRRERLAWFSTHAEPTVPLGHLDLLCGQRGPATTVAVSAGAPWDAAGWAAAGGVDGGPVGAVTLEVNGHEVASAERGLERPDVAQARGSRSFLDTGWSISFPGAALLAPGAYRVRVLVRVDLAPPTVLWAGEVVVRDS